MVAAPRGRPTVHRAPPRATGAARLPPPAMALVAPPSASSPPASSRSGAPSPAPSGGGPSPAPSPARALPEEVVVGGNAAGSRQWRAQLATDYSEEGGAWLKGWGGGEGSHGGAARGHRAGRRRPRRSPLDAAPIASDPAAGPAAGAGSRSRAPRRPQPLAPPPAPTPLPPAPPRPPTPAESVDTVWAALRAACEAAAAAEPALASFMHTSVLVHATLPKSLAFLLANKLASRTLLGTQLVTTIADAYAADPALVDAAVADARACLDRDPACGDVAQCVLYFKGYQALQCHRVAHHLWARGRRALALALQSRVSEVLHVDIHPGASIGRGVLIDHATGVVIGETAVVGDDVSLLHHVTLGGSGTGRGARHPRVGAGALLGAGVCVLGPVTVGAGSKVGAGSVVVTDLPPHCVAVGVPARIVRTGLTADPRRDMNLVDDFVFDYQI